MDPTTTIWRYDNTRKLMGTDSDKEMNWGLQSSHGAKKAAENWYSSASSSADEVDTKNSVTNSSPYLLPSRMAVPDGSDNPCREDPDSVDPPVCQSRMVEG